MRELHHEIAGDGRPVVLLHPGFADARIWDPQWRPYAEKFRVVRCDLRGFGRSQIRSMPIRYALDVAHLLDRLEIRGAALVGSSLGGRVALELALTRPDLVHALVLVGAATPETLATAPEMKAYAGELMTAIAKRDLDAAVEVNMRAWVDGPHRSPEQVDTDMRAAIAKMQRDALLNTRGLAESWVEEATVSDLAQHVREVAVATLVLVGELDMDFIQNEALMLAGQIPEARIETLENTAHAPTIERPDDFNDLVLPFLSTAWS